MTLKLFLSLLLNFAIGFVVEFSWAQHQSQDVVILDVRTPGEFAGTHIKGAKNLDFYSQDFKSQISKLDRKKLYRVYCRSGNRSGQTLQLMKSLGFEQVEDWGGLTEATKRSLEPCSGPKPC